MKVENQFVRQTSIRITLLAILTALVAVLTMVVSIPVPATQGYINLGDAGVLFAGLMLGPLGGLAGGFGSALADYALGYYHYVPITFVVKGLEAALTGVFFIILNRCRRIELRSIIAVIVGSSVMVTGYLIAESWLYGFTAAIVEVPGNIFQVTFGSIVAVISFIAVDRIFKVSPESLSSKNTMKKFLTKVLNI